MNQSKSIHRQARSRGTRALLLSALVASCGCAQTSELLPKHRGLFPSKQSVAQAHTNPAPNQTRSAPGAMTQGAMTQGAVTQGAVAQSSGARSARITDRQATLAQSAPGQVVPVSYQEPMPEVAEGLGGTVAVPSPGSDVSCPPIGCAPDGTCSTCAPMAACGPMLEPVAPYWNDQEYLYDGGDRDPKVQVTDNWRVHGLNSQDTIAHYETLEGKLCVSPSNRVPIYAPRFGAVRKSTVPILQAGAVGARGMTDPLGAVVKASNEPVGDLALPQGPKLRDAIAPIDSLRDRTRGVAAEKILPPVNIGSYQMALGRLQSYGTALRREDLLALLGEYMVNARTWTNPEGISVAISGVTAVQVREVLEAQDITVYETEPGKCSLRICKAASHAEANPGDIISFSIRFDNIGNKPIGNLVILDSLVSRLEYIDGSQQCVLSLASNKTPDKEKNAVKFSTAENEAGSTVLRWECDLPLETADSGVITFRCRVR